MMSQFAGLGASQMEQIMRMGGPSALSGAAGGLSSFAGPIGMVGGAALSGIGDLISGAQQNRAVRRAQDDNVRDMRGQQGAYGSGIFGASYGDQPTAQFLYGQGIERQDPAMIQQGLAGMNSFIDANGGPVIQQQRNLATNFANQQSRNLGYYDTETARLAALANQNGINTNNIWADGSRDLNMLTAGAEQMARGAGMNRDRLIRRDADTQENAMNQRSGAALAASGFKNSTAAAHAQSENARAVGEQRDNALQASADSQQAGVQNARSQRASVGQNLLTSRAGAMERTGENQTGREYQRAGDRDAMAERALTRNIGLQQDPINTMAGALGSGILNPYSAQNFPIPGASGSGTALSSIGGALAGGGSYLMGRQNNEDLLAQIRALNGGR